MDVYRLTSNAHHAHALSGIGARLAGARWNSKGTGIAYTSCSLELAVLESLMHVPLEQAPTGIIWLHFMVPDSAIETLDPLPDGWDVPGPYQATVQGAGDQWIVSARSLALRVPATVLPMRDNMLINPAHSEFSSIKSVDSGPFTWPERLLAGLKRRVTS